MGLRLCSPKLIENALYYPSSPLFSLGKVCLPWFNCVTARFGQIRVEHLRLTTSPNGFSGICNICARQSFWPGVISSRLQVVMLGVVKNRLQKALCCAKMSVQPQVGNYPVFLNLLPASWARDEPQQSISSSSLSAEQLVAKVKVWDVPDLCNTGDLDLGLW